MRVSITCKDNIMKKQKPRYYLISLSTLFFLLPAGVSHARTVSGAPLDLALIDGGFAVTYKEKTVLRHTSADPAFEAGWGEPAFTMKHGSFTIKERNLRITPLRRHAIMGKERGRIAVRFDDAVTVEFRDAEGTLEIAFIGDRKKLNRLRMRLRCGRGEAVYGCGEQFSRLNLRGERVPIWCGEQGIGRGRDLITILADIGYGAGGDAFSTYFAQPTFVSSGRWFFHADTTAYCEFDFTRKDSFELYFWELPERCVIGVDDNMPGVLRQLSGLMGRQPALPSWAYDGVWLGVQGGRDVVAKKLAGAQKAGVPVAAVWAQDWEGRRVTSFGKQLMWNWRYDETLYPDLPGYIRELNAKGIRFLGYINPFLALEKELYREASEKGYLVRRADGSEYHVTITTFPAAVLDLTNPEARRWIKNVIRDNMIGIGLSGWMSDFGEYMPVDASLHSGEPAELYHNRYPVDWSRTNMEAVREAGRAGDIAFFSRAGYTGTSRYAPLIWAGDQLVNWSKDDGLPTVITAGISAGFCGIGMHHSDIGGYTTVGWIKRGRELFMRWAEHSAFTAVMRTHEGNRPEANWQFNSDAATLSHFARMGRVHVALKPYIRDAAREYAETGLPLMRHPFVHYENDPGLHSIMYEYLFGRDLLVAPVIKKGKTSWRVYLPRDEWVHLWSGTSYTGGWVTVGAELGKPPVFYRRDSPHAALFESIKGI